MKGLRSLRKIPHFNKASIQHLPCQFHPTNNPPKSLRRSDKKIVANQQSHPRSRGYRRKDRPLNDVKPRRLDKRSQQINLRRPQNPLRQLIPQRQIRITRGQSQLYPRHRWLRTLIVSPLRNHMAHAPSRVAHIPMVSRNQMQMHMPNCLPRRCPRVKSHIISIRPGI